MVKWKHGKAGSVAKNGTEILTPTGPAIDTGGKTARLTSALKWEIGKNGKTVKQVVAPENGKNVKAGWAEN